MTKKYARWFAFRIELNYSRWCSFIEKGYLASDGSFILFPGKIKLDYISIPILCNFSVGKKLESNFYIGTGINYLLRHNDEYDDEKSASIPLTIIDKVNRTSDYIRLYQSLIGGLGIRIPVAEQLSVLFDSRVEGSLTRIFPKYITKSRLRIKTIGLDFNFGIQCHLK